MTAYKIVVEKLEDGVKQYCLYDENKQEVVARYGTKRQAEEVLIRYTTAMERLKGI